MDPRPHPVTFLCCLARVQGFFTADELMEVMTAMGGRQPTMPEVEGVLYEMDANSDRMVDFAEFLSKFYVSPCMHTDCSRSHTSQHPSNCRAFYGRKTTGGLKRTPYLCKSHRHMCGVGKTAVF